ncbi:hypothetical protein Btru_023572 [Bulinus truncatus]|nr:hypothetical protein Btru_023572 [Bulinus truncatus]
MCYYLLLVVLLSTKSDTSQCNKNSNLCTVRYKDKTSLQPVGCNQTTMWSTASPSKISCAKSCSTNSTCAAFAFVSQNRTCYICNGDLITSVSFTYNGVVTWPLQNVETNWLLTDPVNKYTNQSMNIPINIKTGTLVHLNGYFYSLSGFYIDFRQDAAGNTVVFHFRARRDHDSSVPVLALSYNTSWGPETRPVMTPYPFIENTMTTVDILVRNDRYLVYINQTYCCSYNRVLPHVNVKYLRIIGYIQVYDFSV